VTTGGVITTARLLLVPLRVEDADEMATLLDDERLHEYIGGRPATAAELLKRYAKLVTGPSRAGDEWLNWIVRTKDDSAAVGTVQATVRRGDAGSRAHVAWVIGVPWQGQGFASEAACALVEWLRAGEIESVFAHIHPAHEASAAVARRAGFEPTGDVVDGETVWRLGPQKKGRPKAP
jgi:RimJ/RimL family protein N-acetyltransferase